MTMKKAANYELPVEPMKKEENPWIPYIGDCKAIQDYLTVKPVCSPWLILMFFNALFRGLAQVIFCNNPVSGLFILIALFVGDAWVGLATFAATSTALLASLVLKQPAGAVHNGLTTYNAVLVGSVTFSLLPVLYNQTPDGVVWIYTLLASIFSVYVFVGAGNILQSFHIPLPCLTLPFNIVTSILFVLVINPVPKVEHMAAASESIANITNNLTTSVHFNLTTELPPGEDTFWEIVDWLQVLRGIICSMSQVYAVDNVVSSVLMYIGALLFSPILCLLCILGAGFGTITGLVLVTPPYDLVYAGVWGYNGVLAAASVGGFFYVITWHSFFTALFNAIFATWIQFAMNKAMGPSQIPVLTYPFVLSTLMFLSLQTVGRHLERVSDISFPEMHRYNFNKSREVETEVVTEKIGDNDETALQSIYTKTAHEKNTESL